MKSLYKIEQEYLELINEIEINEGEITEDLASKLEINEKQLKGKSIAYVSVIDHREMQNDLIDNEIKRLQAIKKRNSNVIDNLKQRLLNAVKLFGEFESNFKTFKTRKSESVIVEDVNSLPKEYKVIKLTEQADKKAIKEALKSGLKIKGCELKENLNLAIK